GHARYRVQCAARREAALLPMAAADSGSRRLERVRLEAGVPRHHAGCAASHGDARHGNVTGWRADLDPVRANPGVEEEEARTGRVRVLRGHSRALSAARVVMALRLGGRSGLRSEVNRVTRR